MAPRRMRKGIMSNQVQMKKQEESRQRLQKRLAEQTSGPVERVRGLAQNTRNARTAMWETSASYFRDVAGKDPEEVWLGLCKDDREAEIICQDFLEHYLLNSGGRRLVFGPKEWEDGLTITCALTMESLWKALVTEADDRILYNKRLEDPLNKRQWMIRLPSQEKDSMGMFPASRIRRWILDSLAPEYGLSFEQTFVKREATAEDILRVLGGLWGKADNIPCAPATRVSFDWTLNLLGVTGFRISEVINIPYSQVELGVVRNPSDPTRTALVATIHLEHRKQKTNAVKGAQNHKLQFQVTMVPYRVICLTRKVIAQALSDGAFEAGYTTYDDLLKRPILENVDYVPLRWKATLSNKVMFPITRTNFWTLWRLAQQALGMRDCLNIHSIRVGTGKKLHGVFEPAFRNYILGNTTAVYEKSYIPQLISGKDLMTAAWGALAGNDEITAQLRHATSTRDEDAPMHPTIEDYEMIENREDIKTLRQNLKTMKEQHGSRSLEAKDAKSSLESSLTTLRKLAVADRRKKYFEEADRQRSLGVSTAPLRETAVFKRTASRYSRSVPHAVHIGQLMQQSERQDGEFETAYFKSVIEFIAEIHTPTAGDAKGGGDSGAESKDQECMCLLCLQSFARRPNLTRHTNRAHKRTFDREFQCPACVRERLDPVIITDKFHWSSHIAKRHGPLNAPNYVSTAPQGSARCLICNLRFGRDQRVSRHVYGFHQEQGLFDRPFPCPECLRLDESKIFINGLQEWRQHAKIHHSSATSTDCVLDQDSCLMCGEQRAPAVANKHFNKRHKGIFKRPFQCWTCSRTNRTHVDIVSQSDWYCHVATHHTSGAQPAQNGEQRPGFEKEMEFVQETGNTTCTSNKKRGRLGSEGACSETVHTRPAKRRAAVPNQCTDETGVSSVGDLHDGLVIDPQLFE